MTLGVVGKKRGADSERRSGAREPEYRPTEELLAANLEVVEHVSENEEDDILKNVKGSANHVATDRVGETMILEAQGEAGAVEHSLCASEAK